ncbi:MAG: hypothetical protein ACRDX8_01650 [Acidimicrobiales bacterium]
MAQLAIQGDELIVRLTKVEKVNALRGDVRVPLKAVTTVDVVDEPFEALYGDRNPGTQVGHIVAVGKWQGVGCTTFAALHRGQRAVRVMLDGVDLDEFLIGIDDPEGWVEQLRPPSVGERNPLGDPEC